jgi:hypothetical protein
LGVNLYDESYGSVDVAKVQPFKFLLSSTLVLKQDSATDTVQLLLIANSARSSVFAQMAPALIRTGPVTASRGASSESSESLGSPWPRVLRARRLRLYPDGGPSRRH